MTNVRPALLVASLALGLAGCERPADDAKPESGPPFHAELLRAADEYRSWGRVDDIMRFAPWFCALPPPAGVWYSDSPDAKTHGQKLYSVFAKNREEYVLRTERASGVGQVVVKESWLPKETTDVKPDEIDHSKIVRSGTGAEADRFYPFATKGGRVFKAAEPAGLFIMLKLDPKTPGTDDGWVYGTVTASRRTVTSAGRVESCMGCHQDAKPDRLFGLPMKVAAGKR